MVPLTTGAPIVNAANPGNVLKKPAPPTCASYKEALTAAIVRRLCRSLITIYAFSLIFTILFQARFGMHYNTGLCSISVFISAFFDYHSMANELLVLVYIHVLDRTLCVPGTPVWFSTLENDM